MNLMHTWIVLAALLTQPITSIMKTYSSFQEVDNELSRQEESQRQARFRIGILTLDCPTELTNELETDFNLAEHIGEDVLEFNNSCTYLRISYVEWLKKRNIEVVIIDLYQSDEDIAAVLETLNGILLTGGPNPVFTYQESHKIQIDSVNFAVEDLQPTYYALKVASIIDKAKEINTRRVFVVWGTCLGLESLLAKESDFKVRLDVPDNLGIANSIHLTDNTPFTSFLDQYQDMKAKLENEKISFFYHTYGYFTSTFQNTESLRSKYDLLAVSQNSQGEQFVEMVKHKAYPFFGIQSHPEKIDYGDKDINSISPNSDVVKISEIILDYFLNQLGDWEYDHNQHDENSNVIDLINQNSLIEIGPVGSYKTVYIFNGRKFHFN